MSKPYDAAFRDNALEQQKPVCFATSDYKKDLIICGMCEYLGSCGEAIKQLGQPKPKPNHHKATWALVISDMANRHNIGVERYGTPLQPFNGRDSLQDLYEELLDACCYIKNLMIERDTK